VIREGVREADRARDRVADDRLPHRLPDDLELLAVRVDRGIAGRGRLRVHRIGVRRALVLLRGAAEVLVLEEQVRQAVVDPGRLGVLGNELRKSPYQRCASW
jgi:hypothetical protein